MVGFSETNDAVVRCCEQIERLKMIRNYFSDETTGRVNSLNASDFKALQRGADLAAAEALSSENVPKVVLGTDFFIAPDRSRPKSVNFSTLENLSNLDLSVPPVENASASLASMTPMATADEFLFKLESKNKAPKKHSSLQSRNTGEGLGSFFQGFLQKASVIKHGALSRRWIRIDGKRGTISWSIAKDAPIRGQMDLTKATLQRNMGEVINLSTPDRDLRLVCADEKEAERWVEHLETLVRKTARTKAKKIEGYLWKKGRKDPLNRYRPRYFVVTNARMYYYETLNDAKADVNRLKYLGEIELNHSKLIIAESRGVKV